MIKLVLLTVALLLGCSKGATSDDLDCSAVSDKVVEIIKADMGKLPEAQRKALEAQLATIRSELIEDCR
ncbi:MAG: hypothetical protein KJO07_01115, partial [Deltaproteobacteria bacterium]|nr:hypothetical protein [Deltaproteobacteria bacterium]